jgi:hypothetical protein
MVNTVGDQSANMIITDIETCPPRIPLKAGNKSLAKGGRASVSQGPGLGINADADVIGAFRRE